MTAIDRPAPVEVSWDPRLPLDVRAVVEPLVGRWARVLPREFQQLAVLWEKAPDDRVVGASGADPQYRQGRVEITEYFMSQTPLERERTVLHELFHITLHPLKAQLEGLINDHFDDAVGDPYMLRFSRAYSDTEESVIQSLVFGLLPTPLSGRE